MARETITASGIVLRAGQVGSNNSAANTSSAYDGDTGTACVLTTGDSSAGVLTNLNYRLTAATAKTKTWAYSRAWGKFSCKVLYPANNNDGTSNDPYSGYASAGWLYTGTTTFGNINSSTMNAWHDGSTVESIEGYSSLRSGNPTINANTQFVDLYVRAYAGVGGASDTVQGFFYEFYVEGFSTPTITSINGGSSFPSGSTVTIVGTEFDTVNESGVNGNGVTVSAGYTIGSFTYIDDTHITVTNVSGPPGSCTFTVKTNGGTATGSQTVTSAGSGGKFFAFF